MSDGLFDSYQSPRSNLKGILIGAAALLVIAAAAYVGYIWTRPIPRSGDAILADEIRSNTVMMLEYRTFSGDEFRKQILGSGKLERYIRVNDEAFFTYPDRDPQSLDDFVSKNFYDRTLVEFGTEKDGVVQLGDYKIPSDYAPFFFRTKLSNIKIDSGRTLEFPYVSARYTLSMPEMNNFINGSSIYGGRLIAHESERTTRPVIAFANHGVMIAKTGEPSLTRLVNDLLKDVGPDREARVQRLVDFVSNEIDYSFTEAVGTRETLKRPDETLMTRNGDCSNKTILLASLLEQINEPYILLYCPRHITVAVPQGNFPNDNKFDIDWEGKKWVVAETTLPGFQIGRSQLQRPEILQLVNYIQDPKHMQLIFDASSGESLSFF